MPYDISYYIQQYNNDDFMITITKNEKSQSLPQEMDHAIYRLVQHTNNKNKQ